MTHPHPSKAQRALQRLGGQTILGRGHMLSGLEPRRQRGACLVEDRARRDRRLVTAGRAYQSATALGPRSRTPLARRADKSFRPVQLG